MGATIGVTTHFKYSIMNNITVKIITLTEDDIQSLFKRAYVDALQTLQKDNEPKYYSPAELSEKFGHSERSWQLWVKAGYVGKVTRKGSYRATYKEAEGFLFNRKK